MIRSRGVPSRDSHGRQLTLVVALSLAVGCAGSGLVILPIPVTTNPSEQIAQLTSDLDVAQAEGLDALSPAWFARARASADTAETRLGGGDDLQRVLDAIALCHAELARARSFAALAEMAIPEAIAARTAARRAGAPTLPGDGYADTEAAFLELTEAIENDKLTSAQRNEVEVAKQFRELELASIQQNTLGDARRGIQEARREGASERAPAALARAETTLASAEQFIAENPHTSDEDIAAQGDDALFEANRAVAITREARLVAERSAEVSATEEELTLQSFAAELQIADFRDQSFDTQREGVQSGIAELVRDRNFLVIESEKQRAEIETLRRQVATLEGRSAELDAERRFNHLFTEVGAYFTLAEAEVHRSGQDLVVRLRGIQFPVGLATLQPQNFALLSQVQRAIRAFGMPHVTVEGHTDSTGSATANEQLSQRRADAVLEYLVANNSVPRSQIVAIGKGFSVPLAPNNTEAGRAMNRRIDVIIASGFRATRDTAGAR